MRFCRFCSTATALVDGTAVSPLEAGFTAKSATALSYSADPALWMALRTRALSMSKPRLRKARDGVTGERFRNCSTPLSGEVNYGLCCDVRTKYTLRREMVAMRYTVGVNDKDEKSRPYGGGLKRGCNFHS